MIETTIDFWVRLVLGHFSGDYIFQSVSMALNKSKSARVCVAHCAVYTVCVAIWLLPEMLASPFAMLAFLAIVFVSHVILDKTPFVQWVLKKVGARTFENAAAYVANDEHQEIYKQFYVSFTAIIHAVADNAMHFMLMYVGTFLFAFI